MQEQAADRTAFRPGPMAVPLALLLAIYLPTLVDLVSDWYHDANYSHGFLIPLVSAYLIWTGRHQLRRVRVRAGRAGLLLMILGLVLFVLGTAAAEYFTARFSFVLTLFGLTWYLYGSDFTRRTWFAFFFLCFMIPIPYVIYYNLAFPMQLLATKITVAALDVVGMSVVRQGNIIHIAGGQSLEVAEACSGIRSLVALLALGAIYAYWSQKRFVSQLILFLSTIPIAVVANVVRVLTTSLLVSTVLPGITNEPWHSIMGLSVFVVAFVCLFIVSAILNRVFK